MKKAMAKDNKRLLSLDILRGITIAGMLLVNNILGIVVVLNFPQAQAVMRVLSITLVQILVGIPLYALYLRRSGLKNLARFWKFGLRLNLPLVPAM